MDLVYIFRKYKNIKGSIILLFMIMVVIYGLIIATIILNAQNKNKLYESYKISQNKMIELGNIKKIEQAKKEEEERAKQEAERLSKLPKLTEEGLNNVKNIYKQDAHKAYLTFDDGPSKTVTPKILETLKQENIKATFFLLGSRVELNPELVKKEYEEGHYIANHGYSHIYSQIYASPEKALEEYNKTEQSIKNALGIQEYSSHLFRFPGGLAGRKICKYKKRSCSNT